MNSNISNGKSAMSLQELSASSDRLIPPEDEAKTSKDKVTRFYIPARFVLTILGFGGFCIAYGLRVNLSVALVAMVNRTGEEEEIKSNVSVCPIIPDNDNNSTSEEKEGEFTWDQNIQGYILASFYYGYVVTQLPGGRLAERFGSKWFFGIGVLSTAVLTILTPVVARWSVYAFLVLRILEGLAEGVTFPAMHSMLAKWLPKFERGMLTTIVYSGSQVGTVVTMPLAGLLAASDFLEGWPSVFYVFGAVGCVWFLLWAFLVYESPSVHPRISQSELKHITENQEEEMTVKPPIPWSSIARSPAVWAITFTHFAQNWGFYTLLTNLPTYFKTVLHLEIKKNGLVSSFPYVLQALFAWIAGYITDIIRKKGYASVNTIRKTSNAIAFFGPALCLFGVTVSKCNTPLIIALFSLAMGFNGLIYSGFMVTHVDMSPDFAGTLMGITNGVGNTAGFLAPMTLGALTNHHEAELGRWAIGFYIAIAIYIVGALVFIFFGSANLQPWGLAKRDEESQVQESPNPKSNSGSSPPYTVKM